MKTLFSRRRLAFFTTVALGTGGLPSQVLAWDASGEAKVTGIEITYMPAKVIFKVDRAVGGCATGTMLGWTAKGSTQTAKDQNAQAALSVLMTARLSGTPVSVFLNSSNCEVEFLHML